MSFRRMASLPNSLPVVLCGRRTAIGKPVSQALLPDYEVIHFIATDKAAMAELPLLLAGRDPQSISGNDVGTHNYTQAPRAVIFGRGYELEDINKFRQACANCAIEPIAWVVGDPAYRPDLNARPPGPGYAKVVADTVRGALDKWKKTGALKDEVFLY